MTFDNKTYIMYLNRFIIFRGVSRVKKKFIEAEIEITQYTITSAITTSDDLGNGDDYDWEF